MLSNRLYEKKGEGKLAGSVQFLMFILTVAAILYAQQTAHYSMSLLEYNGINLDLSVQFDALTKVMVIFILVIGSLIYRYARNYLESDRTKVRFLLQFKLVLISVLFFAMAANLLTAFVAWQFISISLYLLLNHYHYDAEANRAAKKKFVINRVGDCSFLLAIILAYHSGSADSFEAIQLSPHAGWICSLLFISVMTKCAQFPFHIWLIDTMETPTPVSALMHAGVINAGGILLTRISGALVHFPVLAYVILFVGLANAALSIRWMHQQPDTKKKLAYSTMGQMGYMLAQCSLGTFPAAVFHLISHGFYKASLFLNFGETLKAPRLNDLKPITLSLVLQSLAIALAPLLMGEYLLSSQKVHIPVLIYGFMLMTMTTVVLKTKISTTDLWPTRLLYYSLIGVFYLAYLGCFYAFSHWLAAYEYTGIIPKNVQYAIVLAWFAIQIYLWVGDTHKRPQFMRFRDGTEQFLRRYLLNPLRHLGNVVNKPRYQKIVSMSYAVAMAFTIIIFVDGVFHYSVFGGHIKKFHDVLVFLSLFTGIVALTLANRCLRIKALLTFLVLFELAFTNIAFFDGNQAIASMGVFHAINTSTVLIMLTLLARQHAPNKKLIKKINRLPGRVFYLVFSLLLLIGIPGTASFISEFYLLNALVDSNPVIVLMYITLMVLVSIVIMHSLQLYAFNKNYTSLLSRPISRYEHVIFLAIIALNIFWGLWANNLLSSL